MQHTNKQTVEIQKVALEIFKCFTEICKKLNLRYYLVAGTLLGAVRHQGFIPWDDDIDVGLMREDYEIFVKEAGKLLPEHIFLQTNKTEKEYPQNFAKLRNTNTTFIESSIKDNNINHGMYIDIFPLDRCYPSKRSSFFFCLKEKIFTMRASSLMKSFNLDFKRKLIRACCTLICPNPYKAVQKLDKLYRSMPNGDYVVNFSGIYGEKEVMPLDWYQDGVVLMFEGMDVTAPVAYEKWLSQVYGDYMQLPPVERRVTHHVTEIIDANKSYKHYCKRQ